MQSHVVKFPYPRQHYIIHFMILTAMLVIAIFLLPAPDGIAGGYFIAFCAMCFISIIVLTITPLFTAHEMNNVGIHLRNGLVFTISIRFEDVSGVEVAGSRPWAFGFIPTASRGRVILANGNRNLVSIKLKRPRRFRSLLGRSFDEIIIDLVSPDDFVKMANEKIQR
ncbi:MAG: hypothetical protein R6W91_03765 [Thermoplasmata archaeon]